MPRVSCMTAEHQQLPTYGQNDVVRHLQWGGGTRKWGGAGDDVSVGEGGEGFEVGD